MKTSPTISGPVLNNLFEEARDASLCRDLAAMRSVLSVFWPDIDSEPDLSSYEPEVRGEWLRHCGWYLSELGKARGFDDQQIRGKNLLTEAIDCFEKCGHSENAAEARIALATCYYYTGEIQEYDAILRSVENEFLERPSHPISIKVNLNKITVANWQKDHSRAVEIVQKIAPLISASHNPRIIIQYLNVAGITSDLSGNTSDAVRYLSEAADLSLKANNYRFAGMNLNSLAMTWRSAGEFEKAHTAIENAIDIFQSMRYFGWLAHAFDTRALILFEERAYAQALATVNQAVDIFSRGEDAAGQADAMWTKVRCLLRLGRTADGIVLFSDLSKLASSRIGESALKRYSALLEEEIYVRKGFSLPDEVAGFKKTVVRGALSRNRGEIVRSSNELGVSHQTLSEILNRQFPDLYSELGIKRRVRRPAGSKRKTLPSGICLFEGSDLRYRLPVNPATNHVRLFHTCRKTSASIGLKGQNVVAFVLDVSPCKGMTVLYTHRDKFHIGNIIIQDDTGLPAIELEDGFYVFLDDVNVIGVPIAYCPAKAAVSTDSIVSFLLMPRNGH